MVAMPPRRRHTRDAAFIFHHYLLLPHTPLPMQAPHIAPGLAFRDAAIAETIARFAAQAGRPAAAGFRRALP